MSTIKMSTFTSDFPIVISIDGFPHYFKKVPVVGTNYNKLVTSNGNTAVAYSPGYGCGWSSYVNNKQMIFDSRLIKLILSDYFKSKFNDKTEYLIEPKDKEYYVQFMKNVFPDIKYSPYIDSFCQLRVDFIPQNTLFKIQEYDGNESIKIFDINDYFTA